MDTLPCRFTGLRLAALVFLGLNVGGALQAEQKEKADLPPGILKKYDKNKDGVLDEKETAKWEADKAERREKDRKARDERLQKYDLNKDGKLNEDELAAAKLTMGRERTERDMVKGKEKAAERIAREKEEKEKQEKEAAQQAAAQKAEAAAKSAPGTEAPAEKKDAKSKAEEEKPSDSMMMMQ